MRLIKRNQHQRQSDPSAWRPLILGVVALFLVGIWVFLQMDRPSRSESGPQAVSEAKNPSSPTTSPVLSDRTPAETFTFYKTLKAPEHAKSEPQGLEPKPSVRLPGRAAEPAPRPLDHVQKTPSKGYTIQVAAFRERQAAISLIHRLKKKGYPASLLVVETSGEETWYRVRLSPYTTHAQAEDVARRLKAEERLGSYIARLTEAH